MDYSSLIELIDNLKHGTRLHIGVVFLGIKRNKRLMLPTSSTIHKGEYCWSLKESNDMADKCYRCRQMAIRKAVATGKPFSGLCINGVWEYTHPVVCDGTLIAIIFIGNILDEEKGKKKILRRLEENGLSERKEHFLSSLDNSTDLARCESMGRLIESYINMMFELCPAREDISLSSSIITDIVNFIEDNLFDNISIGAMANLFHYNEKYIGRLFKKTLGCSIKMYICIRRIEKAMELLRDSTESITAIATKTGFENMSYFNHRFQQFTQMSPSQYRKAQKNGETVPKLSISPYKALLCNNPHKTST